ncbi:hypothetical protein J4208_00030 [Candidatus Woesearchaeota archaeon]|nr:hypothetical protein [Candidatus Woesearchaeota archaeon]
MGKVDLDDEYSLEGRIRSTLRFSERDIRVAIKKNTLNGIWAALEKIEFTEKDIDRIDDGNERRHYLAQVMDQAGKIYELVKPRYDSRPMGYLYNPISELMGKTNRLLERTRRDLDYIKGDKASVAASIVLIMLVALSNPLTGNAIKEVGNGSNIMDLVYVLGILGVIYIVQKKKVALTIANKK